MNYDTWMEEQLKKDPEVRKHYHRELARMALYERAGPVRRFWMRLRYDGVAVIQPAGAGWIRSLWWRLTGQTTIPEGRRMER